jgi:hypothetical protein
VSDLGNLAILFALGAAFGSINGLASRLLNQDVRGRAVGNGYPPILLFATTLATAGTYFLATQAIAASAHSFLPLAIYALGQAGGVCLALWIANTVLYRTWHKGD